jgi:hypothetical protein
MTICGETRSGAWAFKNLLTKTPVEEKQEIMAVIGWGKLIECVVFPPDIGGLAIKIMSA